MLIWMHRCKANTWGVTNDVVEAMNIMLKLSDGVLHLL
jgi:hypothetical protein